MYVKCFWNCTVFSMCSTGSCECVYLHSSVLVHANPTRLFVPSFAQNSVRLKNVRFFFQTCYTEEIQYC